MEQLLDFPWRKKVLHQKKSENEEMKMIRRWGDEDADDDKEIKWF